jgi:hypothetical protein
MPDFSSSVAFFITRPVQRGSLSMQLLISPPGTPYPHSINSTMMAA